MPINLLPEPSWAQQVRRWLVVGLATALVLIDGLLITLWVRADILLRQQENLLATVAQDIRQLQPAYEEHSRRALLAEQYRVLTQWAESRPPWRSDLELLASLLPQHGFITHVELLSGETYWIRAVLPNMAAVSSYMHVAERHPGIARVLALGVERTEAGFQLELQATMNRSS